MKRIKPISRSGHFLGRHGVGRVRIQVRPQLMRRYAPAKKIADRNDGLRRRNLHLNTVEPAPDVHLPDLGAGDTIADAARQMCLTPSEVNGCNE